MPLIVSVNQTLFIVEKNLNFLNNFLRFNLPYDIKIFQNICNIHFTAQTNSRPSFIIQMFTMFSTPTLKKNIHCFSSWDVFHLNSFWSKMWILLKNHNYSIIFLQISITILLLSFKKSCNFFSNNFTQLEVLEEGSGEGGWILNMMEPLN